MALNKMIAFLPVLLVWPIWLYMVTTQNLWYDIFSKYWPATIGMTIASFIAGSTPLGGGVVAFPLAVLVLGFTPSQSRDASVLIQSVGMNAAAFFLLVTKRDILNSTIIYVNIITGCCGMLMGLAFNESPALTNLIYTVTVFCFGIAYCYTNFLYKNTANLNNNDTKSDKFDQSDCRDTIVYGSMILFGLIGGFITASVGSGSDIAVFVHGIYVWNSAYPNNRLADNVFTASSVVVMGAVSGLTAVTRVLSYDVQPISREVILCFYAMAFIVVWGAPIGSSVLTPANVKYLQILFYLLAAVQFVLFGVLKIKNDSGTWIVITVIVGFVIVLLIIHYFVMKQSKIQKSVSINSQSPEGVKKTEYTIDMSRDR